ncbi:MAG: hypothetical protein KID00_06840 [Clostridium argentinense]|uniref:Uncharacterized protein n=1 Tax=Clostridium faecium TaxID=2762223 RepID=A0ABR8YSW6_9CLOT|nr:MULTISPECIES: hypothetical protein [Clostridium]MBD8047357.1 hypothetical protein [Clostridium faecium]MBS5823565.1 hypothetical protein [Clostridium argentinense]MDU1350263.1 hypothetical protein [Clostridium argentinense]
MIRLVKDMLNKYLFHTKAFNNLKSNLKAFTILFLVTIMFFGAIIPWFNRNRVKTFYNYKAIHRDIKKGETNERLKVHVKKLGESFSSIKDILILDEDNNITYSYSNSNLSKDGKFILDESLNANYEEGQYNDYLHRGFLYNSNNPEIIYVKSYIEDMLFLGGDFYEEEFQQFLKNSKEKGIKDTKDFKQLYLLHEIDDKINNRKVAIISFTGDMNFGMIIWIIAAIFCVLGIVLVISFFIILIFAVQLYKENKNTFLNRKRDLI